MPPSVAPAATEIPPVAAVCVPLIRSVPAVTVVAPVYVFAPVRVSVPGPSCVSVPLPLTTCASVTASLRFTIRAPVLLIGPLPTLPVVPPVPSCSVPAAIVVAPL